MLLENIQISLHEQMKAQNTPAVEALRSVLSMVTYAEKAKAGVVVSEEDVIKLLKQRIKQGQDSIVMFEQGNRPELVEKEKIQISYLEPFLPKQASEQELEAEIIKYSFTLGIVTRKDIGKIMGHLKTIFGSSFDGKIANQLIQKLITE